MKPELNLLVWSVVLTVVQMLVAAQAAFNKVGFMALVGNREGMPELTGWGGRATRAHRNMLENLVLFAALVLVAVTAGKTNDMTLLGAQCLRRDLHRGNHLGAHPGVARVHGRPHRHLRSDREVVCPL